MQHNSPLPKQWYVRIERNFLKCLCTYHGLSHEIHKPMKQTLSKSIYLWWISLANRNSKISTVVNNKLMVMDNCQQKSCPTRVVT